MTTASQADVDALAKAIAAAPSAHGPQLGQFCTLWKQVEPILRTLQPIVGLIPVVGTIVGAAIATLLTVGNAAHAAICGGR